jgi:hypothetical protein
MPYQQGDLPDTKMRSHTLLLCCLAVAMLCSVSVAADKKASKPKTFTGTLIKARENTVVLNIPAANGADGHRIFYVNDDTKITVDGKPAAFGDLYHGMQVTVTPKAKNIAKSVAATTPPPDNN